MAIQKYYLIDSSYICYYSAFAAFKSFERDSDIMHRNFTSEFDPTLDDEFCNMFMDIFKNSIIKPVQMHLPFIDKSKYIFCLDASRKTLWRRTIYPEYKLDRDMRNKEKDKFDLGKVFKYAYNYVLPTICEDFGAKLILCNYTEGDDIIAILTNHLLETTNSDVLIISCDKDMLQLVNDRVKIYTAAGEERTPYEELSKVIKQKIDRDISANDYLLFKILIRRFFRSEFLMLNLEWDQKKLGV